MNEEYTQANTVHFPVGDDKDFYTGRLVDDLLEMTLTFTNKTPNHTPRFPERMYYGENSWPDILRRWTMEIHSNVIIGNADGRKEARKEHFLQAAKACIELQHLVRICARKGWISEKERDRWQGLISTINFKLYNLENPKHK